jgi:hypothetical protein
VEGRHGCRGEDRRHGDGTSSFRPTGKTASTRNCHFAAKVVLAASPDKIAATIKKPGVENVLLPFVFLLYYQGPLVCASVQRREGRARSLAQSRSRPWMFQHASARRGDERRRQHRVLSACRPLDKIIHRISNPGLKWLSTGESEGVPSCRSWISARDNQHSTTFSAEDKDLKHGNVLALRACRTRQRANYSMEDPRTFCVRSLPCAPSTLCS